VSGGAGAGVAREGAALPAPQLPLAPIQGWAAVPTQRTLHAPPQTPTQTTQRPPTTQQSTPTPPRRRSIKDSIHLPSDQGDFVEQLGGFFGTWLKDRGLA
jgi:hypothetical protein